MNSITVYSRKKLNNILAGIKNTHYAHYEIFYDDVCSTHYILFYSQKGVKKNEKAFTLDSIC